MHRAVVIVVLAVSLSIAVSPASAQTLTGSGSVTVSAIVPNLAGEPAQVLIPSMASVTMPNISANVTVTNEGTEDYEYFYEWCVMSNPSDFCGSGNNAYYASASKLIALGQTWNTTLTATVLSPGVYYFKTTAYFGSNASSAQRQFTTASQSSPPPTSSGGGGSTMNSLVATPQKKDMAHIRGDFNNDGTVNARDFSILLSYWGMKPPFKNPLVDLNRDGKINLVDFSILLYLWGNMIPEIA